MRTPLVIPLHSPLASDAAVVGEKAAGLNMLLRRRFPVPPGFCLIPPKAGGPGVTHRGLPPDLHRAVDWACNRLRGLVAVRASAVEGRPGQSPAMLGINGSEPAARAVAKCMSAGGDQGARHAWVSQATSLVYTPVIVQRLVDAVASGTACSQNHLTGDRTEVLILGTWGLTLAASPESRWDRFRLRKHPLLLLACEPAAKTEEIRAGPVGLVRRPLPQARRLEACLTGEQAAALARLTAAVEEAAGYPVEVAWTLSEQGFDLLAIRRLHVPFEDLFYITPEIWGGAGEMLASPKAFDIPAEVVSPFAWDLISRAAAAVTGPLLNRAGLRRAGKTPPLVLVAGRVFFNAGDFSLALEQALGLRAGALGLGISERRAEGLARVFVFLRAGLHMLPRLPALLSLLRSLAPARLASCLEELSDECLRLDRIAGEKLNADQLGALLRGIDAFLLGHLDAILGAQIEALRYHRMLRRLRRWCGPGAEAMGARLVAGLGSLACADPGYALWSLAGRIRTRFDGMPGEPGELDELLRRLAADGAGNEIAASLADFCNSHGHLCAGQMDPAVPRWGDDPSAVLDEIRRFIEMAGDETPDGRARQQEASRSRAMAWLDGRLSAGWRRGFFWRRGALRKLEAGLAATYPLCANAKPNLVKLLWRYRRFLQKAGEMLQESGFLDRPEQVFLLRAEEIGEALAGRADAGMIRQRLARREEAQAFYRTLSPPTVIRCPYRLTQFETPQLSGDGFLKGLGASPGQRRGPARLIRTPADFDRLKPGEILVALSVDSGWSPLLLRAGAVVAELGGRFGEAAVIAREYGLPAVVNVTHAMTALHDGDMLEVDGERGLVRILEQAATGAP